jgi:hypothetical protein
MLEAIIWNTYFSTSAEAAVAYIIVILFISYPQEFRSLLSGRIKISDEKSSGHFEKLDIKNGINQHYRERRAQHKTNQNYTDHANVASLMKPKYFSS